MQKEKEHYEDIIDGVRKKRKTETRSLTDRADSALCCGETRVHMVRVHSQQHTTQHNSSIVLITFRISRKIYLVPGSTRYVGVKHYSPYYNTTAVVHHIAGHKMWRNVALAHLFCLTSRVFHHLPKAWWACRTTLFLCRTFFASWWACRTTLFLCRTFFRLRRKNGAGLFFAAREKKMACFSAKAKTFLRLFLL